MVAAALTATGADRILAGLGGHGVAAVYEGGSHGLAMLLRAELDGLPIEEISDFCGAPPDTTACQVPAAEYTTCTPELPSVAMSAP